MTDLAGVSARHLLAGYAAREFLPSEVLAATVARIEDADAQLNAFTTLTTEKACEEARKADTAWRHPEQARALEGIPIAVKDLFDSAGVRTTYGARLFAEHVPAVDATVLARVRAAGALLLGKTATHEFGWGITTNNPHFGPTRNPWAPDRIPGGSSGGSAVALASDMTSLAIGTDTGGSIRIPSVFCGVSGLKPTWGRISGAGAMPVAPTLDHPGPMAREPGDLALLYETLAHPDSGRTASSSRQDEAVHANPDLAGLCLGICASSPDAPLSRQINDAFRAVWMRFESLGMRVAEVEIPDPSETYRCFVTTQRVEALGSHTARDLYPRYAAEYGADVRQRLDAAREVTLADYMASQTSRERLRAGWARLFDEIDILLTPVSAISAPRIGEELVCHGGRMREVRELVMPYTVAQDLVGVPACTVRAGLDRAGLPIGFQLTGPWRAERLLLACASALHATAPELSPRPTLRLH